MRLDLDCYYPLRIPYRCDWRRALVEDNTTSIYINGLKMDCEIGAEINTNDVHISLYSSTKLSQNLTSGSARHRKGLQSCIE